MTTPIPELPSASLAHLRPGARVVAAMSGGVDSSVAAWLLREAGHPLVGLFMRNGVHLEAADVGRKSCCSTSDARDARMVAAALEIPFQAVDLGSEFKNVIEYFTSEYSKGRTPNPCAVCNRDLKFRRLLDLAEELGAEAVATGHYARLDVVEGRVRVRRGVDRGKDQSYQLFCVDERDLRRTVLPLGEIAKPVVRSLAERAGLRTAKKPDSQEICFVPGDDYRRLLADRGVELHPGDIVDTAGRKLGTHPGTEHFTIGQRRGLGVALGQAAYVVDVRPESGTVVIGTQAECSSTALTVDRMNWIGVDPPESGTLRAAVQVRYHHDPAPARIELDGDRARVVFDEPVNAVARGQGAALYDGERLLGGGWIAATELAGALTPG
jgi:tRNA-specific 2-thiouridylase